MVMTVNPEDIKKLREMTGSGIMDCKQALAESNGNIDKAIEILRKRGRAKAQQKASRSATEGIVTSYIHHSDKIGVLLELASETDFVARNEVFQELAQELAMQIAAASPAPPQYISAEDVPEEVKQKETEIYREQARQDGKPEKILDRIAEGRLQKFYQQVCLLEQPYIRDDQKTIKDVIAEKVALLGENIRVNRFVRFCLGEKATQAGV